MSSIVYICVNYQSPAETLAHLEQLRHMATQPYAAVVVENSPNRHSEIDEWMSRHADNHRYLVGAGNVGYLNGLGIGARRALEEWPDAEWFVLSNVDLVLDAVQFERRLASHFLDPQIGIVGPRIVSSLSAQDQNPFLVTRPSLSRMRTWRTIYRSHSIGALYQLASDLWRRRLKRAVAAVDSRPSTNCGNEAGRDVYAVHGSIFCLSGRFLNEAGELWWPCFLFGEEIWFAERARKLGLRVVYDAHMNVKHGEHVTTASLSSKAKMRWHHQSIDWLIENHWIAE